VLRGIFVSKTISAKTRKTYASLYERALPASRTGALYGAFPYPTKISPEAIALFIAAHTEPGDTVFDGFAGSGTTGIAAMLCENPTPGLRAEAARLGLKVKWGARDAVLYEISALGAFIARTLTTPPDPHAFARSARQILESAEGELGWMYEATDPAGGAGNIRHIIWADELLCPKCRRTVTLWDACVSLRPAKIASSFTCPDCQHKTPLDEVRRRTKTVSDELLGEERTLRSRRPIQIMGRTANKSWSRPANKTDLKLLERIARTPVPDSVPLVEIPWGDLYRSGYHEGITHLHHFYTRRNLIAFARVWQLAAQYRGAMRDALRFWLLSYNASHATIMSRVVAKAGQQELVTTSAQPGVLYVSGLPVEKNLFEGLRRKLKTITQAFETTRGRVGKVTVHQRSSCDVQLPNGSIDYAFTDPPFGGNIPYAEVNFINEAWLDTFTNRTDEIIVSRHQEKSLGDYQTMMAKALNEVHRILKPRRKATLVFHSASADVWNALQSAYKASGFNVERTSILDKTQGSFKQVTTEGYVRGDPVLLLEKTASPRKQKATAKDVWQIASQLHEDAYLATDPQEKTAQRLYSRLVGHFLLKQQDVPLDADTFYRWLATKRAEEVAASVPL
jgi:16S rRNA G966 N2-methylase RsmD